VQAFLHRSFIRTGAGVFFFGVTGVGAASDGLLLAGPETIEKTKAKLAR
jgi:hypothetical protein